MSTRDLLKLADKFEAKLQKTGAADLSEDIKGDLATIRETTKLVEFNLGALDDFSQVKLKENLQTIFRVLNHWSRSSGSPKIRVAE